jgi:uncharacterized protein GlcG (DUF336 family)
MPSIGLTAAQELIEAAHRHAKQMAVPSTVTVLDAGGRFVAGGRMDGAPLISIDTSAAKARTAAFFKTPTSDLVEAVQPGAALFTIGAASEDPLTFLAGGLPIFDESGDLVGALGSGGGTPEQDAEIAGAAVAQVKR